VAVRFIVVGGGATLVVGDAGDPVDVVGDHRRLVVELRRRDHGGQRSDDVGRVPVRHHRDHRVVDVCFERLHAFTIEGVPLVEPLALEALAVVHHLRAGLVEFQLQRLDLLDVTHRVEVVGHLEATEHLERVTIA
jgi:hypothetical protein